MKKEIIFKPDGKVTLPKGIKTKKIYVKPSKKKGVLYEGEFKYEISNE